MRTCSSCEPRGWWVCSVMTWSSSGGRGGGPALALAGGLLDGRSGELVEDLSRRRELPGFLERQLLPEPRVHGVHGGSQCVETGSEVGDGRCDLAEAEGEHAGTPCPGRWGGMKDASSGVRSSVRPRGGVR